MEKVTDKRPVESQDPDPKRAKTEATAAAESVGADLSTHDPPDGGGVIAATQLICQIQKNTHYPEIDLSLDRQAWKMNFPPGPRKAGREKEICNLIDFDAFDEVDVVPSGVPVYDMTWVEEYRGDLVRSRLV
eukprot:3892483-Amphidinium_carterae.1